MPPRAPLTLTRLLISTTRPLSSTLPTRLTRQQPYSSQTNPKPKSATGEFYKTFTRPVVKTILIAILTYQLIYYAWLKLEQDEIKGEKNAEIAELEAEVSRLEAVKAEETARKAKEGVPVEVVKKKGWWPF
ncbi:hypothetical protein QBC34DRAFT_396797 [Podospora aff. communis PSN243]|uniref:Uncharacterized protein n=1 Tax=Podospora aff. communis PSN243 TaxID=3040156 RepID=A0AAV9GXS9_9PEZI|nr:hypothetical protein QBC34DRAFT_396797 [Podospora aff. communis PSN243]